ncbi:hypothetical protein FP2506_16614 [Fulvimarina pelagi HTCC2506]|uniref:Uncharacterized protein n=1 Tax=Fulvimarina pelagi HTCC2506 TaxID=314231 RepID=Q0G2V7_9HYPH|nr:hypothetical protein FP2506_16614 [Fulvimarina pelagi HTCC2506]
MDGGLIANFGVLKGGGIVRTLQIFAETLPDPSKSASDIVVKAMLDPDLSVRLLGRNIDPPPPVSDAFARRWRVNDESFKVTQCDLEETQFSNTLCLYSSEQELRK